MNHRELKSFSEIPRPERQPSKLVVNRDKIAIYKPNPKEPVVNSETGYEPIDRVAARVIAPANWYCLPPEPAPKKKKPMKGTINAHLGPISPDDDRVGIPENGMWRREEVRDLQVKIISDRSNRMEKNIEKTETLIERAQEINAALDYLCQNTKTDWIEFDQWIQKATVATRQSRIGLETETRQLMSALREVRMFFMDERHEEEVKRVREFVALCHQLKRLKEDGTIDAIFDAILKLEIPDSKA